MDMQHTATLLYAATQGGAPANKTARANDMLADTVEKAEGQDPNPRLLDLRLLCPHRPKSLQPLHNKE